jgi:hypothetical protein
MAVLASGLLLGVCWHYLLQQVSSFEATGMAALLHMWLVAVLAAAVGQLVRRLAP